MFKDGRMAAQLAMVCYFDAEEIAPTVFLMPGEQPPSKSRLKEADRLLKLGAEWTRLAQEAGFNGTPHDAFEYLVDEYKITFE